MKTTLVIGGAGLIGSTLCRDLIQRKRSVLCYDNLSTGSLDNLRDLMDNPNFEFVYGDLLELCSATDRDLDYIYLLACPASPQIYQRDPVNTLNICYNGTLRALKLAQSQQAKLIFTSTSEVYGDPRVHPQTEDYHGNVNPVGPRSCYDEGKRVAETLITEYCKTHEVEYCIARVFNTYGPHMSDDGRVLSNFIRQARAGAPLTIYGDGTQTRSFCYDLDLVRGLITMEEIDHHGPINLGNPEEITINNLAHVVIQKFGNNNEIIYRPLPVDDPIRRRPDINKARELLNWDPEYSLRNGLDHMKLNWYSHNT